MKPGDSIPHNPHIWPWTKDMSDVYGELDGIRAMDVSQKAEGRLILDENKFKEKTVCLMDRGQEFDDAQSMLIRRYIETTRDCLSAMIDLYNHYGFKFSDMNEDLKDTYRYHFDCKREV